MKTRHPGAVRSPVTGGSTVLLETIRFGVNRVVLEGGDLPRSVIPLRPRHRVVATGLPEASEPSDDVIEYNGHGS